MMAGNLDEDGLTDFPAKYKKIEVDLADDICTIASENPEVPHHNCLKQNGDLKDEYINYLKKYNDTESHKISVLYLGMNPSRIVKNAVPFDYATDAGNRREVRKWLGIEPSQNTNHNLDKEAFWGFMKKSRGTSENFFQNCVVRCYCPVAFSSGENNISLRELPQEYSPDMMDALRDRCDKAVKDFIQLLLEGRQEVKLQVVLLGDFREQTRIRNIISQFPEQVFGPYQFLNPACRNKPDEWQLLTMKRIIENKILPDTFEEQCLKDIIKIGLRKTFDGDLTNVMAQLAQLQMHQPEN